MSDTIADDTDAEFLAAAQRLLKKRDAQIGRLLALLKEIVAYWPATTNVLLARAKPSSPRPTQMGNKQMATPLEISIALHYHCRVDDYGRHNGDNNFDAPAVVEAIGRFQKAGLLTLTNSIPSYKATPGLTVYVDALCAVPKPVQQWVIPKCDGR